MTGECGSSMGGENSKVVRFVRRMRGVVRRGEEETGGSFYRKGEGVNEELGEERRG